MPNPTFCFSPKADSYLEAIHLKTDETAIKDGWLRRFMGGQRKCIGNLFPPEADTLSRIKKVPRMRVTPATIDRDALQAASEEAHVDDVQESGQYVGEPDGLNRLWTPHRMAYVGGENKPKDSTQGQCPFCVIPSKSDQDGLIVARGDLAYVVLNLYPYNSGHLMVVPFEHVSMYSEVSREVMVEMGELTQRAVHALSRAMNPSGFNIGMNQGEAGGAGIAAHLHQHVVPRWVGDSNFFPIIGQTKAMPALLADTRDQLARAWQ